MAFADFFWYTHNQFQASETKKGFFLRHRLEPTTTLKKTRKLLKLTLMCLGGGGLTTLFQERPVRQIAGLVSGPYYGAIQVRPNRDIRLRAPATSLRPFPTYLGLGTVPYGALSSRSVVPYGRGGARWTKKVRFCVLTHAARRHVLFGLVRLLCSHSLASFATPCRKRNSP